MDDGKKDNNTNSRTKLLNFIDTKILKDILDAFTETTGLMGNPSSPAKTSPNAAVSASSSTTRSTAWNDAGAHIREPENRRPCSASPTSSAVPPA